jgi:hypothetical protein
MDGCTCSRGTNCTTIASWQTATGSPRLRLRRRTKAVVVALSVTRARAIRAVPTVILGIELPKQAQQAR